MTKKRRHGHSRSRAFSESDVPTRLNRNKRPNEPLSHHFPDHCGASAAAVSHFQALQSCSSSAALADVFEWLGDAVIGELVGRCLLSHFQTSPLSARVFRNLRLAVVTNRNLAQVYDAMGYAAVQRHSHKPDACRKNGNMKQRADVVEAVVGELVLKLHEGKRDLANYRTHLDMVVATMLHCHFVEQSTAAMEKGETLLSAKGPLSVAFNPFACLPDERLDEISGKVIVTNGVEVVSDVQNEGPRMREYIISEVEPREPYHAFATLKTTSPIQVESIPFAMPQLDEKHILRSSREIFEVFKVYGMAVLSERISLLLVLPHVERQASNRSERVTPAKLTRQRQHLLSVSNLAAGAISMGIAELVVQDSLGADSDEEALRRVQEEYRLANTLRAFVGYHSAVATTSTAATKQSNVLIATICNVLCSAVDSSKKELKSVTIPKRESLVAMTRSVGEARIFMNSKACDGLHARGERPVSKTAFKWERELQPSLILRQCNSNILENLFETLDKEQKAHRKQSNDSSDQHQLKRRVKKKRKREGFAATAGCMTRNLERFLHRRFLFCLEEIVVLFAQHQTEACRARMPVFEHDLEPCVDQLQFRKWEVSTSTLTLAMRDSFFRMLLHDICQFHAVVSTSRNTRDGTRITQLRLPLHYTWSNIDRRITTEQQAQS